MYVYAFVLFLIAFSIPPAATTLAIIAAIYALIQALKKIPALTPYIKGWVAVALNIALSAGSLLVAVPASQLYTQTTLIALITTALAAAGIHGTVQNLSAATDTNQK